MGLSFVLFGLKLFHEFIINFGGSVGFFVDSSALFDKDFELFSEMVELFFEIEFSLIVDNFIVFDSFDAQGQNFFVPLSLLKLQLNSIQLFFCRFDLIVALIFVSQVLIFDGFVLFLLLFQEIKFSFTLKFLLINRIVLFPYDGQVFVGSTILQVIRSFLWLFSEFGQLSASNKGEIVIFNTLVD